MKKALVGAILVVGLGAAHAENVALRANVELIGDGFWQFYGFWNFLAPGSTVVDGLFHQEGDSSSNHTVFWTGSNNANTILVTLPTFASVNQVVLQADSNDYYLIEYLGADGTRGLIAAFSPGPGRGLYTRSATFDAVTVSAFLITGQVGDGFYGVSEFQAIGTMPSVPEPASLAMLALGLGALAGRQIGRNRSLQRRSAYQVLPNKEEDPLSF